MHYPKSLRVGALAVLVALSAAIGAPQLSQAEQQRSGSGKYLGRWNYDQPDRATGTNIATSNLPGRGQAPQIGDIVFTEDGRGGIVGRTDVGCTWRFAVHPDSLELDSSQLCHNPTSKVAYTISQWTVTVEDDHETETIIATSHHPSGNYDFVLRKGARTKAREYDPIASAKFAGTWTYTPADLAAGINVRTTFQTTPVQTPEQGQVTITRDYANRITAKTGDGCTWSLLARGNTAKLDPAIQTCTLATSAAITIRSWTIATDGRQQASVMTGTDERGDDFALGGGSLRKN